MNWVIGNFIIAGGSSFNSSAFLIETDNNGNEIWHQFYANNTFYDLVIASDENIITTGNSGPSLIVQKVSSSTNSTIWSKPFNFGEGHSITECFNNDLLILDSMYRGRYSVENHLVDSSLSKGFIYIDFLDNKRLIIKCMQLLIEI